MLKHLKIFTSLVLIITLVLGCGDDNKVEKEISQIPVTLELVRFDKAFANATANDLPQLRKKYPIFFPAQYPDSMWVQKFTDTLQQQLNIEVLKAFNNDLILIDPLTDLFKHIKYYFPDFTVPKVYTSTSYVDYRNKVIVNDSLLLIELDTYLGQDHPFYVDIPKYQVKNLKASQIMPDIVTAYSKKWIASPKERNFLSQMLYYGKQLYLKDVLLPQVEENEKIGYTPEELSWAKENEIQVWQYFVENELLYSTDIKLLSRFITPAPFSKFNLVIDNESPGMIGRYMGWQMVKAYVEKTNVALPQLLEAPASEIFKTANYKPKK